MRRRPTLAAGLAGCFALFFMPLGWSAPESPRIHHAEPVALSGLPLAGAASKPSATLQTGFEAFGRRFDLSLESNARVLERLETADRRALPSHALYQGTVVGRPGSWVRLTQLKDGVHGLVYDGRELFVLAPAAAIARELDVPLKGVVANTTVAFRAADATSGLHGQFCEVVHPTTDARSKSSTAPDYKAVFTDLRQHAAAIKAAAASSELDLALVADTQFVSRHGDPYGEMLVRLNNVDGIFSSQVGVRIVSSNFTVLADNGGMTSLDAGTLLDQFESYRYSTPQVASHGLAHLLTGRQLNGTTVGIAFMSTLCASRSASSLSQTLDNTYYSSLVFAHELGHNFGAPHDGDGVCASTPTTYLMSPSVNGSSTFSQCSLQQMQPRIDAATCLRAPSDADVAVELPDETVVGYLQRDIHVPVDVVVNAVSAQQVNLSLTVTGSMQFVGGTVAGGTCTANYQNLSCQLGNVPADTRRTIDAVLIAGQLTSGNLVASVMGSKDGNPANNTDSVAIEVQSAADGSVTLSSSRVSTYVGEAGTLRATVSNAGPQPLDNATLQIDHHRAFTVAVTAPGSSCTTDESVSFCTLGTLAAGETRQFDLTIVGNTAARGTFGFRLESPSDVTTANNSASVVVEALPQVELTVEAQPGPTEIELGTTVTQSFTLRSTGPRAVESAAVALSAGIGVEIVSISATGASCVELPGYANRFECSYAAPIESGGSRRIDVLLRAISPGNGYLSADPYAPESQHIDPSLGYVQLQYLVRANVDLALSANPQYLLLPEKTNGSITYLVESVGLSPAANSRLTITAPTGLRTVSAQASTGSCTVAPASVTCELGTINHGTNRSVTVQVTGDTPATYSLAAQVSADTDAKADNDTRTVSVSVIPDVDLTLTPPPNTQVRIGRTIDYPVTLRTGIRPVDNVVVAFSPSEGITVLAATPSQGSCEPMTNMYRCTLGTMPGNGSATITVRLRGDAVMTSWLTIGSSGNGESRLDNNSAQPTITVTPANNLSLSYGSTSMLATQGVAFELPNLWLTARAPTDDVRVEFVVPTSFTVENVTSGAGACSTNAGRVVCEYGSLLAGASHNIYLRVRPNQTGTYSITAQAMAADEPVTDDNTARVSISVNGGSSSGGGGGNNGGSGGGGGGGGIDPAALLLLLVAPAISRRRRSA